MSIRGIIGQCAVVAAALILSAPGVMAASTGWNFREDFNGAFSQSWSSGEGIMFGDAYWGPIRYTGAPAGNFESVAGSDCYRMTNRMDDCTRVGTICDEVLSGSTGRIEVRINTLTQDQNHLDGLFDLWLINAADTTSYTRLCLFSDCFGTRPLLWTYTQAQGVKQAEQRWGFPVQSNTWYRIRVDVTDQQFLYSVWDDAGTNRLIYVNAERPTSMQGNDFQIGVAQYVAVPNWAGSSGGIQGPFYTDVAIDYISATAVPEPSSILVLLTGVGALGGVALRRFR